MLEGNKEEESSPCGSTQFLMFVEHLSKFIEQNTIWEGLVLPVRYIGC